MTGTPEKENRPGRGWPSWTQAVLLFAVFVIAEWVWPVADLLGDQ